MNRRARIARISVEDIKQPRNCGKDFNARVQGKGNDLRILITGDKGFVGSNLRAALEPTYKVVGLEARERFRDWWTRAVKMNAELPRLESELNR